MREQHGMTGTPAYQAWARMRHRLSRKHYLRRGIGCCERWDSFLNFYSDMGEPPKGMWLERKDNAKGYSPENCTWASVKEQCRNRSSNVLITYAGETKCLTEWAEQFGIKSATVRSRIGRGMPLDRVFSTNSFWGTNRHTKGRNFVNRAGLGKNG